MKKLTIFFLMIFLALTVSCDYSSYRKNKDAQKENTGNVTQENTGNVTQENTGNVTQENTGNVTQEKAQESDTAEGK